MKQFNVPGFYRSSLIAAIKAKRKADDKLKKDFSPTLLDFGTVRFYLARHFGFCYGVENAIEIAYRCIQENKGKRIFLLSEMIHNPQVNADLQQQGVRFLQDSYGKTLIPFEQLTPDDEVIIPAFGTTMHIEEQLLALGISPHKYNTTCPFVEKVWNRGEQLAEKGYSLVIHGKPAHEETRATFSRTSLHTPAVIVNDMKDAEALAKYITGEKPAAEFYETFKGRYSAGFDISKDLQRFGVINQTTQLATDTQAIADYLKEVVNTHLGMYESNGEVRFADTRDTLCYATNDNQTAVREMLNTPADLAFVIGGYNSSNTSHLVELCEEKLPTYYINSPDSILNDAMVKHYNWRTKEEKSTANYMPDKIPVNILVTSGASCPDALVEEVIERLLNFFASERTMDEVAQSFA
ncbi:MAG TPA: 4-hydroxy-3-methylbut-2-enyl diphosphate reductase [Phnomibacter sp.]|nr:4-hydroxy-3-methylbut-2-enyl diphosphate reductase [Phnomibacter sp.]